ncbi:MAG: hypothetical protein H8D56_16450 [Planctomycetes bacterium]|nr:hypothetical protein [Planctomycetota bacterium]
MRYPTLAHFRHFSHFRHSFNYNIFPDTQIMQNKPNLRNDKMSANLFTTRDYEENDHSGHQKTKPIQTQFKANKAKNKANLSQNKPNLSQNKPNSNPNKANYFHSTAR